MNIPDANSVIYVAGHRGMVGSAIVRLLEQRGFTRIVTRTHQELDLTQQLAVRDFFQREKIDYIILAAAKVGGIYANDTKPADFIYENLMIEANVIHEAFNAGVKQLLLLGSSCIYPKLCKQPMKEEYLLTGALEPTNDAYAVAKIAGIKMCESYNRQYGTDYRIVMPTNLYGPGDRFHLLYSHVAPAMIYKFHLAKLAEEGDIDSINAIVKQHGAIPQDILQNLALSSDSNNIIRQNASGKPRVVVWGTGTAYRELMHVDDLAAACVHVMQVTVDKFRQFVPEKNSQINAGSGQEVTIKELAERIKKVVGFKGDLIWDQDKPDGTPRKLVERTRLENLGWQASIPLEQGLRETYHWFVENVLQFRD